MKLGLALDLSSPTGTFFLFDRSTLQVIQEVVLPGTFTHSETLLSELKRELLKLSFTIHDIDSWVLGCGPGSFTGLRIAYATIKAFAFAHPHHQVFTLEGPEARAMGFLNEFAPTKSTQSLAVLSYLTVEKIAVTSLTYENGVLKKESQSTEANPLLSFPNDWVVLSEERINRSRVSYLGSGFYHFPLRARHLRFVESLPSSRLLSPEEIKVASPLYFGSSHFD